MTGIILSGNEAIDPQELTDAEVNHLRRLLAWLTCEYNLSEAGQKGMITGLSMAVAGGADLTRAQEILDHEVSRIKRVPAYVRQAVRMLDKAIKAHDTKSKVVEPSHPGASHD